ncbi:MAG: protein-disulfide reductase DsbD family protein [Vicinamibacterales bacterium]
MAYQERNTVASILAREGAPGQGPIVSAQTAHLSVQATASDGVVAPGQRITLTLEVTPARGMHVYAPGNHTYQVIRFQLAGGSPWLRANPLVYPPSEIYHFVPLDERVETYQRAFTLRQDVTVLATPDAQKALADQTSLTVAGRLEYQACDDKVCYAPASVPITFTLDLTRLVRPQ